MRDTLYTLAAVVVGSYRAQRGHVKERRRADGGQGGAGTSDVATMMAMDGLGVSFALVRALPCRRPAKILDRGIHLA